MPMETRHDLEHTTERLTEGLRCPWKWGLCDGYCYWHLKRSSEVTSTVNDSFIGTNAFY